MVLKYSSHFCEWVFAPIGSLPSSYGLPKAVFLLFALVVLPSPNIQLILHTKRCRAGFLRSAAILFIVLIPSK